MLDQRVADLARLKFHEYYQNNDVVIDQIEKREFGFGDFETKIRRRHMTFRNNDAFKRYLLSDVPPFISISTAYYRNPDGRPMENKGWLGAELVFDLDATDLNLDCQKEHGRGWICDNCLSAIKNEALKTIEEFLIPDFGISKNNIEINFSGNRGYHIHVKDRDFFSLNSNARKQISDYLNGKDLDIRVLFPTIGERLKALKGPTPTDGGWGGRIARTTISAINGGNEQLVKLGIDKKTARKLIKNKAEVVMGITTGNWDSINVPKKADFWRNIISTMTVSQTSAIDKNVTNSPEHLIRVANTIHADTGLVAKKLKGISDLEKFDPMKDAIIFKNGRMRINVSSANKLFMNGMEFGPYNNTIVEVPTYVALYLMLKRCASLA